MHVLIIQSCFLIFQESTQRKMWKLILRTYCNKVHIFWEGHKILRNLHQLFVLYTASQIIGEFSQNSLAFLEYMNFNKNCNVFFSQWLLMQFLKLYYDKFFFKFHSRKSDILFLEVKNAWVQLYIIGMKFLPHLAMKSQVGIVFALQILYLWQINVSFFIQCTKMQLITLQNFNIQTCFSQFLWFFSLKFQLKVKWYLEFT